MPNGVIKKLVKDRGFGFISQEQGDIFFHCTAVTGTTFEELQEGQSVSFEIEQGRRGPQATQITPT